MAEEIDDSTPELDKYEEDQSDDRPLSPRQEQYCQEFIIDMNQTKAAARAGYSSLNAYQQGSRLSSKAKIQARIQVLMDLKAKANQISVNLVLAGLIEKAENKEVTDFNQIRALELLGKHLGLFKDRIEHSNPDGKFQPLAIITMPSNGRDKPDGEE